MRNILMAHVDIYLFRSRANIASEVTRQAQYIHYTTGLHDRVNSTHQTHHTDARYRHLTTEPGSTSWSFP
jgi:hypothetical protein